MKKRRAKVAEKNQTVEKVHKESFINPYTLNFRA